MKKKFNPIVVGSMSEYQTHYDVTPQAATVLQHMISTGGITQREALMDYSIQSLTRRITEIRDAGWDVLTELRKHPTTGQRYARYILMGMNPTCNVIQ